MNCCRSNSSLYEENHEEKKVSWKTIMVAIMIIVLLVSSLGLMFY